MLTTIFIFAIIVLICYWVFFHPLGYWKRKNVKYVPPVIIFGNFIKNALMMKSLFDMTDELYNYYDDYRDKNMRYVGLFHFWKPILMIRDPDLIKKLTIKEFDHFMDHRTFLSEDADPLFGKNLFALHGRRWREMRATLSPAFTSSKMKAMFPLIVECADRFCSHFENKISEKKASQLDIELKDSFTRFTNDVIASIAFGIHCDSLKNPNNEFYLMGKRATSFSGLKMFFKLLGFFMVPKLMELLKLGMFDKELNDFFSRVIKETMELRRKDHIVRPDMIHLLMEAQKGRLKADDNENDVQQDTGFAAVSESVTGANHNMKSELTDEDIIAQALIFFVAGFETSSVLMCFAAYEIALNPEIQNRLRCEIDDALAANNNSLTYDAVAQMKYLDMVICETLRKWAPAFAIDRICVKPYTIEPERDEETPVHLNVGDIIWIPVYALHHDQKYYPNDQLFDPDRFSEENRTQIPQFAYLPFGVGPRNCIGSRFALLESKVLLVKILSKFNLVVTKQTQIPLKLKKSSFTLSAEKGIWLGLKLRSP